VEKPENGFVFRAGLNVQTLWAPRSGCQAQRTRPVGLRPRLGGVLWGDEKFVLHWSGVHLSFVARVPPLRRGGQGGWSRRNHGLVCGSRTAGPRGIAGLAEHVRYALSTPPDPPFARGGKGSLTPKSDRAQQKQVPGNRSSSTIKTNFSSAQGCGTAQPLNQT
jgi:hypothetical protein